MAAVGAVDQEQGTLSRTRAGMAGMGELAEHMPCSSSLTLWVLVLVYDPTEGSLKGWPPGTWGALVLSLMTCSFFDFWSI